MQKVLQEDHAKVFVCFCFSGTTKPSCSEHEWKCGNSAVCISDKDVCNGRWDCADGSDEGPGCSLRGCHAHNGGCSHICANVPGGVCKWNVQLM